MNLHIIAKDSQSSMDRILVSLQLCDDYMLLGMVDKSP